MTDQNEQSYRCCFYDRSACGRKIFGQTEENHEAWKPARRLVGHESGRSPLLAKARAADLHLIASQI